MKFYDEPVQKCFLCGRHCECARHHLIGGAYRQKADDYELYVSLCPECHDRVHHNGDLMRRMRAHAQRKMMHGFGWSTEDWIREFGKNYLEE